MKNEEVAILYSGGSDSTLSTVLVQGQYKKIHLITYKRFGLFSIENTRVYVDTLKEKFGADKFTHSLINIDRLFKFLSYHSYFRNLFKHKFFLLSTCGFCKLAMHARTIIYCLENQVKHVCDGSNKGMDIYPAQMKTVIEMITRLYETFGISFTTPVFDFTPPEEKSFIREENQDLIQYNGFSPNKEESDSDPGITTETKLFELGITPQPRVKGSKFDKQRQGRCFQLILFRIFAIKSFLASHTMDDYIKRTVALFDDKIRLVHDIIREYIDTGKYKKLFT